VGRRGTPLSSFNLFAYLVTEGFCPGIQSEEQMLSAVSLARSSMGLKAHNKHSAICGLEVYDTHDHFFGSIDNLTLMSINGFPHSVLVLSELADFFQREGHGVVVPGIL